jgi:hypothetical protein
MTNQLEKWRNDEKALAVERQLMKDALAQLGRGDTKTGAGRSAGRLIFGLDLTGSREHSLQHARIATAAMFDAIRNVGAVAVKLIYYRGNDECKAGKWRTDPAIVSRFMLGLSSEAGYTQIERMLRFVLAEEQRISGVVFVGDHCEDDPAILCELAQAFGRRSMPLFVFHECADHDERSLQAKPIFKRMAELSGGVYSEFKPDNGAVLKELLSSVAAFSAAGAEGVEKLAFPKTPEARQVHARWCQMDSSVGGS